MNAPGTLSDSVEPKVRVDFIASNLCKSVSFSAQEGYHKKSPPLIRKGGLNVKLDKVTSTTPLSTSMWTGGFASPGLPGFAFSIAIDFGTKKHITPLIATKLILKSEFVFLITATEGPRLNFYIKC